MIEEQELLNQYFKKEIIKLNLIIEEQYKSLDKLIEITNTLVNQVTQLEVAKAIDEHLKNKHIL